MILDKPKRRAETIVGILEARGDVSTTARQTRTIRALRDVEKQFDISISIGKHHGLLKGNCSFAHLTITAVIHSESLESRWARALDMIRDQYGLQIEWERQEVRERNPAPVPISDWINSRRDEQLDYHRWCDHFLDRIAKDAGIPREVLGMEFNGAYRRQQMRELELARQAEEVRKQLRYGPGLTKHDIECALLRIDGVESVKFKENFDAGKICVTVYAPFIDTDIRTEVRETISKYTPCGTLFDFEIEDVPPVEESFGRLRGAEAGADIRKSYSDTPTGTVEWDGENRNAIEYYLKKYGEFEMPFRDALHLVDCETGDDDFDIICPVCGDGDLSGWYLYASHVSELFGALKYSDNNFVKALKSGVTCDSCHHHLTYDFDNEIVTIRRGE